MAMEWDALARSWRKACMNPSPPVWRVVAVGYVVEVGMLG